MLINQGNEFKNNKNISSKIYLYKIKTKKIKVVIMQLLVAVLI